MNDWQIKGKPALLILHMQKGMVGAESPIRELAGIIQKSGIIPRQQALLKAFRSRHLPVIFVNVQNNTPIRGALPARGALKNLPEKVEPNPRDLEVIPELTPQPGEPVLTNWPMSAFNNSGLDHVLRVSGAETLVLAGFATNGVVLSALIMAIDRYYSVVVPSDASTAISPKAHEVVMEILAPELAVVTPTDNVIAHL